MATARRQRGDASADKRVSESASQRVSRTADKADKAGGATAVISGLSSTRRLPEHKVIFEATASQQNCQPIKPIKPIKPVAQRPLSRDFPARIDCVKTLSYAIHRKLSSRPRRVSTSTRVSRTADKTDKAAGTDRAGGAAAVISGVSTLDSNSTASQQKRR